MSWQWSSFMSSSSSNCSTTTTSSSIDSEEDKHYLGSSVISPFSSSVATRTNRLSSPSSAHLLPTAAKMLPYSVSGLGWQYQVRIPIWIRIVAMTPLDGMFRIPNISICNFISNHSKLMSPFPPNLDSTADRNVYCHLVVSQTMAICT